MTAKKEKIQEPTEEQLRMQAQRFMQLPEVQAAVKRAAVALAENLIRDKEAQTGRGAFPEDKAVGGGANPFYKMPEDSGRTKILAEVNTIITKDRAATHGEAEDSFQIIANYWSVYLTKKLSIPVSLSPMDISQFMTLFKIARIHSNPGHRDNWLDQVGYSAIGAELALKD